jgi:hypothetical protein
MDKKKLKRANLVIILLSIGLFLLLSFLIFLFINY